MYILRSNYSRNHKLFIEMNDEDMFYALWVSVPFTEAKFYKGILWSEFFHIANQFYGLNVPEARELFNDAISDLLTDCITEEVSTSTGLKLEFLQRSKRRIGDRAKWKAKRKKTAFNRA